MSESREVADADAMLDRAFEPFQRVALRKFIRALIAESLDAKRAETPGPRCNKCGATWPDAASVDAEHATGTCPEGERSLEAKRAVGYGEDPDSYLPDPLEPDDRTDVRAAYERAVSHADWDGLSEWDKSLYEDLFEAGKDQGVFSVAPQSPSRAGAAAGEPPDDDDEFAARKFWEEWVSREPSSGMHAEDWPDEVAFFRRVIQHGRETGERSATLKTLDPD